MSQYNDQDANADDYYDDAGDENLDDSTDESGDDYRDDGDDSTPDLEAQKKRGQMIFYGAIAGLVAVMGLVGYSQLNKGGSQSAEPSIGLAEMQPSAPPADTSTADAAPSSPAPATDNAFNNPLFNDPMPSGEKLGVNLDTPAPASSSSDPVEVMQPPTDAAAAPQDTMATTTPLNAPQATPSAAPLADTATETAPSSAPAAAAAESTNILTAPAAAPAPAADSAISGTAPNTALSIGGDNAAAQPSPTIENSAAPAAAMPDAPASPAALSPDIAQQLQQLQDSLAQLQRDLDGLKQANNLSPAEFESRLSTIENRLASIESAPRPSTRAASSAPRAGAESARSGTASRRRSASAPAWVLRSASNGQAMVSKAGSSALQPVQIGDNLAGIGRVTAIAQENGKWMIRGTSGVIRQ